MWCADRKEQRVLQCELPVEYYREVLSKGYRSKEKEFLCVSYCSNGTGNSSLYSTGRMLVEVLQCG